MLWAALTADQFAGQPFCDYLRLMNHEQAFANIRFWVAAQQFLSGKSQMDTLLRRRQAQAMIQMYMLKDSPRKTSIGRETLSKLVELLPNDLGYSVLHAACGECANVGELKCCRVLEASFPYSVRPNSITDMTWMPFMGDIEDSPFC